jgi:hypothetical protein
MQRARRQGNIIGIARRSRQLHQGAVVGKGGTAGFLGKGFDPYTLYPDGDDMDLAKMDRVKTDDLQLPEDVFSLRLERRADMRRQLEQSMPDIEKAVSNYKLDEYYDRALQLIVSGRARKAFDLSEETPAMRDLYGRNTFGQSCLLARRLVEAGTRVVEVIWPKVANSDNHSWDHHVGLTDRMRKQSGPMLDTGFSALIEDLDSRGLLDETLVVGLGEFGRSPQKGVSTSGNSNSGTSATEPASAQITPTKISANGASAATKSAVEVMADRTTSNCRIWDAKVPTVWGRASIRIDSAFRKNTSDNSVSIALNARSTIDARVCFMTNSNKTPSSTPIERTQSVDILDVGTTRS